MAKVDEQGRITIPKELVEISNLKSGKIGIFWSKKEDRIFIGDLEMAKNNFCVGVRSLDSKFRFVIKNYLNLIGADKESELVVAAVQGRVYFFKLK